MKHFGEAFSELLKHRTISKEDIALKLGCTRSNLYHMEKKESESSDTIDKVCRIFNVTPLIFFDKDICGFPFPDGYGNEYNNTAIIGQTTMNIGHANEVKALKQIIEEKERLIQFLLKGKDGIGDVTS